MNKLARKMMVLAGVVLVGIAEAFGFQYTVYPYEVPAGKLGVSIGAEYARSGMELELGKWYTNMEVCKKYADDHDIPLLAVWGNSGCIHCWYTEECFTKDAFKEWQAGNDAGQVILCFMAGGETGLPDQANSTWYNWMWKDGGRKLGSFPFVVMWWKSKGVNVRMTGDEFCANIKNGDPLALNTSYLSFAENTVPTRIANFTKRLEKAFEGWSPVKYTGGVFADGTGTANDRLEIESGTTSVTLNLVRDARYAGTISTNVLTVTYPAGKGGSAAGDTRLLWSAGETAKKVNLAVDTAGLSNGNTISLLLKDENGEGHSTNRIWYVEKAVSESNPLWIGERTAETLQWGEWTMDFDVAKAKAASADGEAYTIVSIEGSLWCPDCNNVDRNFMNIKDGTGANRFEKWARQNNVALVAIDVPSFADAAGSFSSPTLLSRTPYTSTLARAREYPASGASESLLTPMLRSGLGYLTRKGVDDATAAATLERNRRLVTTDVSQGGFHSAADSNPNRTGVPVFVVLDKNGNVKARLTRFASVSPMADVRWDDVIKRFDELLAIARGDHDDGGVLENDFPGAGIDGFTVNGGTASGEISHCDFRDIYRIKDFDGNGFLLVEADGESDANVALSLVRLDANRRKETIATSTGPLSDGVFLAEMIDTAGTVYVEIAGANFDDAFSPTNPNANAFYGYTLNSEVILVPGETRSTASAPEGSDTISLILEEGATYRIEGLADEPGEGLEKTGDNFYVATARDFDYVSLKTASVGGEIVYQLWRPGKVGFTAEKKTVIESAGEVRVDLARTEGTSGAVTVRVSLDADATTLYNSDGVARFEFETTEITWAEGESGTASVAVKVLDDARFDGPGVVALKIEVTADENDDTALGTATYALTVNEDDKQSPGMVAFTGVDPFFSKKQTVYARESEGATIYAERIEIRDGEGDRQRQREDRDRRTGDRHARVGEPQVRAAGRQGDRPRGRQERDGQARLADGRTQGSRRVQHRDGRLRRGRRARVRRRQHVRDAPPLRRRRGRLPRRTERERRAAHVHQALGHPSRRPRGQVRRGGRGARDLGRDDGQGRDLRRHVPGHAEDRQPDRARPHGRDHPFHRRPHGRLLGRLGVQRGRRLRQVAHVQGRSRDERRLAAGHPPGHHPGQGQCEREVRLRGRHDRVRGEELVRVRRGAEHAQGDARGHDEEDGRLVDGSLGGVRRRG